MLQRQPDPIKDMSLDQIIHAALGQAAYNAESGYHNEAATWASIAQAASTFHLSQNLSNALAQRH
ncbi:hypothetical protein [Natronoglycomyces albus]|uniref:Uncharacterized protein n=1 Tax=Natronoglycomyces albus TaxID=2811108 RepID=A0A895XV38_9ACTN|nr:hypothetical protein [Natronoglycomyces albus]QSB07129.1 hypothetical protein JQS30_16845 [Natronoglycomyces albus]